MVSEHDSLELYPPLTVELVGARSTNPAYKRNLGVAKARGEILAFLDDDAFAPPEWLSRAIALLEEHPAAAGLGGPNLIPPASGWRERVTDALLTLPVFGSGNPSYGRSTVVRNAHMGDIHLVNMFVRREVYESVGGLNESIGYGGEDTELIYLVQKRLGRYFIYTSDLFVYHYRRPFGPAYLKQRFKLRTNTGLLGVTLPGLYARKTSFWSLVFAPLFFLALAAFRPFWALAIITAYAALVLGLSLTSAPSVAPLVLLGAPFHHGTYAAGLYWGIVTAILRPGRRREIRERRRLYAEETPPPPSGSADLAGANPDG